MIIAPLDRGMVAYIHPKYLTSYHSFVSEGLFIIYGRGVGGLSCSLFMVGGIYFETVHYLWSGVGGGFEGGLFWQVS